MFAPTRKVYGISDHKDDSTIYRLRIMAERCIFDPYNTGGCQPAGEYLILGMIYPEEITTMKIVNDDLRSELYDGTFVRWFPKKDSVSKEVKDPGNWLRLI